MGDSQEEVSKIKTTGLLLTRLGRGRNRYALPHDDNSLQGQVGPLEPEEEGCTKPSSLRKTGEDGVGSMYKMSLQKGRGRGCYRPFKGLNGRYQATEQSPHSR
eukprot:CAMPEP_0174380172 /NCGR_PEP_ID=MMETSP0811_2-20130205/123198_1 /TAXON_ID=73025 ORGANISM="Eutreptiella gymnastica-like, Strain CCMP1594" /NCGR_SAMPLE_ID=MMETSP0811_2 /ASSEMBLY_ACC=CAM_ASM_000667 /LENGTH=102 /DNA_ID=CAMNT_0015532951 /DNA_START=3091 /DNA_END=3395 /DNA_ORIENTATION=-